MKNFIIALSLLIASGPLIETCVAQVRREPVSQMEDFLRHDLRESTSADDKTAKYTKAFVDLNGDGMDEVIVYITGRTLCGTGGCNTLVLARQGATYRVVADITITRPPIRVLKSKSNGWRNLSVWVEGGGIRPGYEAELPFDGNTYARNPSVPPAHRLVTKTAGEVVIRSSEGGTPLYR